MTKAALVKGPNGVGIMENDELTDVIWHLNQFEHLPLISLFFGMRNKNDNRAMANALFSNKNGIGAIEIIVRAKSQNSSKMFKYQHIGYVKSLDLLHFA